MDRRGKPVIIGNWKMNLRLAEGELLAERLRLSLPYPGRAEVVVAPGFVHLSAVARRLERSFIAVAAQDLHIRDNGPFTGDCSGAVIREAGARYVLVGHSERRAGWGESDETVNGKVKAAFRNELIPVACVGETLAEREAGKVEEVLTRQACGVLAGLGASPAGGLIWAYEPVWAIGTGKSAGVEQAREAHEMIRETIRRVLGEEVAGAARILYGGSVKAANAAEFLAVPGVDGVLAGGASLDADEFIAIVKAAG